MEAVNEVSGCRNFDVIDILFVVVTRHPQKNPSPYTEQRTVLGGISLAVPGCGRRVMRSRLQSQKGFTILETLVAAGVSGALLAAALPNLSTALSASSLQAALRSTAQHVRLARATAVGKNLQSRIVVGADGSTLTTQVLRGSSWTNSGTPLVLGDSTQIFSVSPSASALTFTSQGTTSGTVTITLRTARGDSRSLVVSLLGSVEAS